MISVLLLSQTTWHGMSDESLMMQRSSSEKVLEHLELSTLAHKPQKEVALMTHKLAHHFEEASESRMNGTSDAPVDSSLVDVLKEQFGQLENYLKAEHGERQQEADALNAGISNCNSARNVGFTSENGVTALLKSVNERASSHATCRSGEHSACENFRNRASQAHNSVPKCSCEYTAGTEITSNEVALETQACFAKHAVWTANYPNLDGLASACTDAVTDCNGKQVLFESTFCAFKSKLVDTCDDFALCLQPQDQASLVEQRTGAKTVLEGGEVALKDVFKVVQVAKCHLDLLAQSATPTKEQVQGCRALSVDVSHLDVTYPTFVAPLTCDVAPASPAPGDPEWVTSRYSGETWASLVQVSKACAAATTPAPSPATTTPPPAPSPAALSGYKYVDKKACTGRNKSYHWVANATGTWSHDEFVAFCADKCDADQQCVQFAIDLQFPNKCYYSYTCTEQLVSDYGTYKSWFKK